MTDQAMQKCSKCGDMTLMANGNYCIGSCGTVGQMATTKVNESGTIGTIETNKEFPPNQPGGY